MRSSSEYCPAPQGSWTLDETIQGRIIAMASSIAIQIERDLVSARSKEAIVAKMASWQPIGRSNRSGKGKLDPFVRRSKRYNTKPADPSNWSKQTEAAASVRLPRVE